MNPANVSTGTSSRELSLVYLTGEVFAQHTAQLALQIVGPEVVLAQETTLRVPSLVDAQCVPAVSAGVDEAAKLRVLASDDDEGLVLNVVLLPVAGLRQIFGTADDLPHPHPDRFPFALRVVGEA